MAPLRTCLSPARFRKNRQNSSDGALASSSSEVRKRFLTRRTCASSAIVSGSKLAFDTWTSASSTRSEEHTSELQSLRHLVCRLLLEKKKKKNNQTRHTNEAIHHENNNSVHYRLSYDA